jgi:hypothetical protein
MRNEGFYQLLPRDKSVIAVLKLDVEQQSNSSSRMSPEQRCWHKSAGEHCMYMSLRELESVILYREADQGTNSATSDADMYCNMSMIPSMGSSHAILRRFPEDFDLLTMPFRFAHDIGLLER